MSVRITEVPVVHLTGELPSTSHQAFPLQPTVGTKSYKIIIIQDESLARGPKLLYIKNYVIQIMT